MSEITKEIAEAASAAGWTPPQRLAEVVKARNDAVEQANTAKAEAAASKAAADAQAVRLTEWDGKSRAWDEERGIFRAGVTDAEAIEVARFLHGKLPEADRKPLPEVVAGWVKLPDTAPPAFRAYLGKPEAAQVAAPGAPAPRSASTMPASGAADVAAGVGEISREEIAAARAELARGNPAPYAALRPRLIAGLK